MFSVFLSHSNDMSLERKFLKEKLSEIFPEVEMAVPSDTDIHTGENWQKLIEDELRNAQVMVVIITPESAHSPQTFFDIGAAVADGKKIVAVLSEEIDPENVPEPLRHLRWVNKSEAAEEIARAVKAIIRERQSKENERQSP